MNHREWNRLQLLLLQTSSRREAPQEKNAHDDDFDSNPGWRQDDPPSDNSEDVHSPPAPRNKLQLLRDPIQRRHDPPDRSGKEEGVVTFNSQDDNTHQDPPSLDNTSDYSRSIPPDDEGISFTTTVRQRKLLAPAASKDWENDDPPGYNGPLELGADDDSEHIPLHTLGGAASWDYDVASSSLPSILHAWRVKTLSTISSLPSLHAIIPSHILSQIQTTKFKPFGKSLLLLLVFGLFSLLMTRMDLTRPSIHLAHRTISYSRLSSKLSKAIVRLNQTVLYEYGNYSHLFWDENNGDEAFTSNSLHRLRRRLMYKILVGAKMAELKRDVMVNFTWVTGGDGSSAGYGNL